MAEENQNNVTSTTDDAQAAVDMSRDDMSALEYVLHHVKGSSASSVTLLQLEEMGDE